jgi:hypothetical protein
MISIHFFRGEDGQEPEPLPTSDDSTYDLYEGKVVNIDYEPEGIATLYTEGGNWYITLERADIVQLARKVVEKP